MTPQFLRSEAARFREMAESTEREASRQRLLNMAADYETRAAAADKIASPPPPPSAPAEPEQQAEAEVEAEGEPAAGPEIRPKPRRRRLSLQGARS